MKPDYHPAGVQLFLFIWVKLFGDKEFIVKLPFIISGLFAIFYSYKVAAFWFNNTVGTYPICFYGWHTIYGYVQSDSQTLYERIAVFCFDGLVLDKPAVWVNITKKKWWIGYVVSSVLCAYDQHFDFLFAITVGLTGLFFLTKENWKMYLFAGISIFILYIPHFSILFSS